jgi:glutathione S-transferase
MADIKLLGLSISVYTRIARMALEEKGIDYRLEEVDVFADSGPPADYLALNPFATIPCLLHGDFVLYETSAITRYLDEIAPTTDLQPSTPIERARMNQIIGMLDSYCYRPMVWDVYVQRIVVPAGGGEADEALIAAALTGLSTLLKQLDQWRGERGFLVGQALSLADLHLYPMLSYFTETTEGVAMLESFPRLQQWMRLMRLRHSVRATPFHTRAEDETEFAQDETEF